MARASMAELIARLRVLAGDPAGDGQKFSDDELEEFLDERRGDVDLAPLRGDQLGTGNSTTFRAPFRYWEADAVLADGSGGALTADDELSNPLAGSWTFATGQTAVYVTGRWYDLYGSAAAVLQARAARVAEEFDFTTDNQQFNRSQKREALLATAREYMRKAISPGMRTWHRQAWET